MRDTKKTREKRADGEEQRQRERELAEALNRADESAPLAEGNGELGDLDSALENHENPMTTGDVITAYGDRKVETQDGWESVKAVFTSIDDKLCDSPDDVRNRILGLIHRG